MKAFPLHLRHYSSSGSAPSLPNLPRACRARLCLPCQPSSSRLFAPPYRRQTLQPQTHHPSHQRWYVLLLSYSKYQWRKDPHLPSHPHPSATCRALRACPLWQLQENPFRTSQLEDCPAEMYSRMSNSNRDCIFLALTNLEIAFPEKILHAYYTVPDYLTPSIKLIREITDSHSNDTYKQLTVIRDAAEQIYSVSRQNGWLGFRPIDCMIEFTNEVTKCLDPKGESNFEQLRSIFTSFELNLQRLIRSNAYRES